MQATGESAAQQYTMHTARYLLVQQCWPKYSFCLLHFHKFGQPTRPLLAVVASGGCTTLWSGSVLLGVHVPHALGSVPVLLGVVCLFLPLPAILGMPVLWLVVFIIVLVGEADRLSRVHFNSLQFYSNSFVEMLSFFLDLFFIHR